MADRYTDVDEIERRVNSVAGRIVISAVEPSSSNNVDISRDQVERIRIQRESMINLRLGRFYTLPLRLTDENTRKLMIRIATDLASYDVWTTVHPTVTTVDLPAAVKLWRDDAMAELKMIAPEGKAALDDGVDVILAGESLRTSSGSAATPAVAFTSILPAGGSRS